MYHKIAITLSVIAGIVGVYKLTHPTILCTGLSCYKCPPGEVFEFKGMFENGKHEPLPLCTTRTHGLFLPAERK